MGSHPIKPFLGEIKDGVEVPAILPYKRRKGNGINLILLGKMKIDDSIWQIPRKKMLSLLDSARHTNPRIKLKIRHLGRQLYAVFRIQ